MLQITHQIYENCNLILADLPDGSLVGPLLFLIYIAPKKVGGGECNNLVVFSNVFLEKE